MILLQYQPIDGAVDGHRGSDFWERHTSMRRLATTRLVATLTMLIVTIFAIACVLLLLSRSSLRHTVWVQ